MSKLSFLVITVICSLWCSAAVPNSSFPKAEYQRADVILMHTPGIELFDGVMHPAAGLYEKYFDIDKAADEHSNFINMLRANGIEVFTVEQVLRQMDIDTLRTLAAPCLIYKTDSNQVGTEQYRQETLNKMSVNDLIRILLLHPTVLLNTTDINTGVEAAYLHSPLMNLYFLRDQSISTPRGQVMCRMNSSQRSAEVNIIEACYRQMGIKPAYRIKGENSYLEGGDYIPFGTMGLIGLGLRTTQEAIDEMLEADVIGHDTLVVVRDHWKDQYQMHLDTYFNIIDRDLATMCFNRYDAKDASDKNFLTIDMYARKPGTRAYHKVKEYAGYSFKQFLAERGVKIIRIDKRDADHYANNFLTIERRHIMSVAGQSDALAREYQQHGVTVEWVPLDNLIGGYGAAHCMTQVLLRH